MKPNEFSQCFDHYETAWRKADAVIEQHAAAANPAERAALQRLRDKYTQKTLQQFPKLRADIGALFYSDDYKQADGFLATASKAQSELSAALPAKPLYSDTTKKEYAEIKNCITEMETARATSQKQLRSYYEKCESYRKGEQRICANFFDDASLTVIDVRGARLKIECGTGKQKRIDHLTVIGKYEKGHQHIELPKGFCQPGDPVEVSLSDPFVVGCTRYLSSKVSLVLTKPTEECCCIPIPLHQLKEACTIRFTAIDGSRKDFIENAKSFLNTVEWVVTAVRTPAAGSETPGASSFLASAANSFRPWTATVRSVEGNAEVFEIPPNQLYQIQARAPEGYIGSGPALMYRYIGSENFIEIKDFFRPCSRAPARSAVFVQQQCQGVRWANATVLVGGRTVTIDGDGIMKIPEDMSGILPITFPQGGKSFSPGFLDLSEGAVPVSTITVADQPVTAAGLVVQNQFVDFSNRPFAHRPVSVLLPNGDEIEVLTDDEGFFEAPTGSKVFAREDDLGFSTEKVLVVSRPTS